MPPKGSKKAVKAEKPEEEKPVVNGGVETAEESKVEQEAQPDHKEHEQKQDKPASKKRKANDTQKEPSKASRRSSRGAPKSQPSAAQLLNFLLTDKALELTRPQDETDDLAKRGKSIKTYSGSILTPFEELLCAVVLSRPISHRLGQRTIRTILNDPYNYTSPDAITAAKPEDRHQAMFDAHTQHKDKTATQIGLVAKVVIEQFSNGKNDTSLEKLRSEAGKEWDAERDMLQSNIKGVGNTGLDIFFRRVQWLWEEAYPFVDERTARGIEKLGLPKTAEGLREVIEKEWKGLDKSLLKDVKGEEEKKKRRAFVVVCERATGADLEGKGEALVEAAAAS